MLGSLELVEGAAAPALAREGDGPRADRAHEPPGGLFEEHVDLALAAVEKTRVVEGVVEPPHALAAFLAQGVEPALGVEADTELVELLADRGVGTAVEVVAMLEELGPADLLGLPGQRAGHRELQGQTRRVAAHDAARAAAFEELEGTATHVGEHRREEGGEIGPAPGGQRHRGHRALLGKGVAPGLPGEAGGGLVDGGNEGRFEVAALAAATAAVPARGDEVVGEAAAAVADQRMQLGGGEVGELIGGGRGGDVLDAGLFEYLEGVGIDPLGGELDVALEIALPFVGAIGDAHAVAEVVGHEGDAALAQPLAVGGLFEDVVGPAADQLDFQLGNGARVDLGADGARGEDVGVEAEDLLGGDRHHPRPALDELGQGPWIDVGGPDPGAGVFEQSHERLADVAHPLDGDPYPGEVVAAGQKTPRRLHAAEDPPGGVRRGISTASQLGTDTCREAVGAQDGVHVGGLGADVFGGVVDPAEAGDEAAVGAEELEPFGGLFGAVGRGVEALGEGNHALAAAPPETGEGVFAGHPLGQAQTVEDQLGEVLVGFETHSALGQAAAGVVDAGEKNRRQARLAAEEKPLVLGEVLGELEIGLERSQELGMREGELAVFEDDERAFDPGVGQAAVESFDARTAHLAGEVAAFLVDFTGRHRGISGKFSIRGPAIGRAGEKCTALGRRGSRSGFPPGIKSARLQGKSRDGRTLRDAPAIAPSAHSPLLGRSLGGHEDVQVKQDWIERVVEELARSLPEAERQNAETLARALFEWVPSDDVCRHSPRNLAGAVISLLELAQERNPDRAAVRILNPQGDDEGFDSKHTVVQIVNDDMPFLVDSVVGELTRRGREVHLLAHPQMIVERGEEGRLLEIEVHPAEVGERLKESLMHVEIDQLIAQQEIDHLQAGLEQVLDDVRSSVEDWHEMRRSLHEMIGELGNNPPPLPADELFEAREFLQWVDEDHYTFLGCREYVLMEKDGRYYLKPDLETGLGILQPKEKRPRRQTDRPMTPAEIAFLKSPSLLSIGKSSRRATVHRPVHMDVISIKRFDEDGQVVRERRFMGLFTSRAYTISSSRIPIVRRKVERVIDRVGFLPASHDAKVLRHILENYPRDELFQISENDLYRFSLRIHELQLRPRLTLLVRRDEAERFVSCMIYVPRDRHTTRTRRRILEILEKAFDGRTSDFSTQISDRPLAQIHATIQTKPGAIPDIDFKGVERLLTEEIRSWGDRLKEVLLEAHPEVEALEILRRYDGAFPVGFEELYSAREALADIARIEKLLTSGRFDLRLERWAGAPPNRFHCKTFELETAAPLTAILPRLENMGLKVLSEIPYEVEPGGSNDPVWVRDFEVESSDEREIDLERVEGRFKETLLDVWEERVENDGLNRLVLRADLESREVVILRAYARYLRQTGAAFSLRYMEEILGRYPGVAKLLVELFHARFDPRLATGSEEGEAKIRAQIDERLEQVRQLDEDRILRRFLNLVEATVRTNYYQKQPSETGVGEPKGYLSVKFDASRVRGLPKPRPKWEIFVYSPRVEGVHLRGGKVARGGIRWSDRREDFRTEILGLVKAQMVKNAVIVPVGAKGGFVLKKPPAQREDLQTEGVECYKTLIRGMLDLTDNIVGEEIVPPKDVVRHDGDDTYLVVAADKGTAKFSDVANGVAAEYGFWLGDAFASGGSAGYDHKAMGITARGAWESVKQHFREMGRNTQKEPFTVVGVGDMSGDVFGNGMLLSEHIRLVGAFNHLHIFIDPDPDPAASFAERRRLFGLERSSWTDYDREALSKGGGIYERAAKSLTISPEVRGLLELPSLEVTPNRLIRALLRAQVDLLWFGGIGTYVKASWQSQAHADDRANNEIRLGAHELRAKVIGEGANLGVTQAGRVEYAQNGGRINTDFIDNSGGVDCSDHEVNIKIALADVVASGRLERGKRDQLLEAMTEQVGELVLHDNYLQSLAITLTESQGALLLGEQSQLMRELERAVKLDRKLENLPNEEALAERRKTKKGLTRPEIAVLLAHSKIHVYGELINSPLPDDPQLVGDLVRYFPKPLHKGYREQLERHRLRREIIATHVTNSMVNRVGPTFVVRMAQETGSNVSSIARAYTVARDVFDLRELWGAIEKLDDRLSAKLQVELYRETVRLVEVATRWFLRHGGRETLDISAAVSKFKGPAATIAARLDDVLSPQVKQDFRRRRKRLEREKVPKRLAPRLAGLAFLPSACDIAECAEATGADVERVGKIYFALGERFGFYRLRRGAERLESDNHWQKTALTSMVEELFIHQANLTQEVAATGAQRARQAIEVWAEGRRAEVKHVDRTLELISDVDVDLSVLMVAGRELRKLAGG